MSVRSPWDVSHNETPSKSAPRYAELIYASCDDLGSGGGWQVKDESGDLTAAERQALTARIATRFDAGEPLPTYPTPAEIADRRARLVYSPLKGDAAAYWHTVDAGRDATGRPGNVFAHVVLDRQVSGASPVRPIELWKSPHWLRPYGAAEVASATLAGSPFPEPAGHITPTSVITFLIGTEVDRQSVFRVLLDAVHHAMSGGPGVMLTIGDLDNGPSWIAAVSYFMSPATARRFSWSTHDDPALAAADLRAGIHLVVVTRDRAIGARAREWIAIDERDEPDIGQLGSTHRTSSGTITVTGWSVLGEGVLGYEFVATKLLAEQDRIAAALGDHDLAPEWPLAVAVRHEQELSEFHADADQIIADDAPPEANNVEWIGATVAAAIAATAPTTIADAHQRLLRARQRRAGIPLAAQQLLRNILAEPEWIVSGPLAELPAEPVVDLEPFRADIADALKRLDNSQSAQPLRARLRMVELLQRLGSAGTYVSSLIKPETLNALSDSAACRPLLDDDAISLSVREKVLRPLIARRPARVLDTYDRAVWQWLFGDDTSVPVLSRGPHAYDAVLLPRYVACVLSDSERVSLTAEAASRLATDATYLALAADGLSDADCRDLVTRLSVHSRFAAPQVLDIFTRWPRRVRPAAAISALYYEPLPAELIKVIAGLPLTPDHWDRSAVAAARLRVLYSTQPWSAEMVEKELRDCAPTVLENLSLGHVGDLADDLLETLAVLILVGQARGEAWSDVEPDISDELRQALAGRSGDLVDLIAELIGINVVDVNWFVTHAVLRRLNMGFKTPTLFDAPAEFSESLIAEDSWSDLVSELIERGAYVAPSDPVALRDSCWPVVRALSAEQADKFFSGYVEAAREWLEPNHIGGRQPKQSESHWTS